METILTCCHKKGEENLGIQPDNPSGGEKKRNVGATENVSQKRRKDSELCFQ